jgi:hypothetical protein
LLPHEAIAAIEASSDGPSKKPHPWMHAYSVPERLIPRNCKTWPAPSTSLWPDTRTTGGDFDAGIASESAGVDPTPTTTTEASRTKSALANPHEALPAGASSEARRALRRDERCAGMVRLRSAAAGYFWPTIQEGQISKNTIGRFPPDLKVISKRTPPTRSPDHRWTFAL